MHRYNYIRPLEVNVNDIVIRKAIEEWLDSRLSYVHHQEFNNDYCIEALELQVVLVFMVQVGLMDKHDARKYLDYLKNYEERFEDCEEREEVEE